MPAGPAADVVVDVAGGAVLPGLHDHHVHLMAMAAARQSVDVAAAGLAGLRAAPGTDWVRAVGYHESLAGPLDRDRLDALVPERPVRVQHRSGQLWVLNSEALRRVDVDSLTGDGIERDAAGRATGRLYRMDDELRRRIGGAVPDVGAAAAELAAHGITAVTDLTAATDAAALQSLATAAGADGFPLAVAVTGAAPLAELDVGLPRGPVKVVLDDARLPALDDLVADFRRARRAGRSIAVHCVTRAELVLALAAWDVVGARPGDRVEHGAVIPAELLADLRERGLVVVTQPSFVTARGDQYRRDVDAADRPHLWRCGSLLAAGIGVAGSSDAPYGDPDPWRAVVAARDRSDRRRARCSVPASGSPRRAPSTSTSPHSTIPPARRGASCRAHPPTCACSPCRSRWRSPTRRRPTCGRRSGPASWSPARCDPRTVSVIRPDRAASR